MPSTMQHSMVKNSAMSIESVGFGIARLMATTPLMSFEASPVTVMQPAMMPAMEQATATVMLPLPPASSALRIMEPVLFAASPAAAPGAPLCAATLSRTVPIRLTAMATRMAIAAENCSERTFAVTIHTRIISGSSRYRSRASLRNGVSSARGMPFRPSFFASRCTAMKMPEKYSTAGRMAYSVTLP